MYRENFNFAKMALLNSNERTIMQQHFVRVISVGCTLNLYNNQTISILKLPIYKLLLFCMSKAFAILFYQSVLTGYLKLPELCFDVHL